MSPIIVETGSFANVVGMIVLLDEVLDLFTVLLVFFGFIFIVDFGFDIEESGAAVSAALATMALRKALAIVLETCRVAASRCCRWAWSA